MANIVVNPRPPITPLHVINVLFLNLTEFPFLRSGQLEPQGPRVLIPSPGKALKSAVAKYHSGIYCFKKDYKKVENAWHTRLPHFHCWEGGQRAWRGVGDHPKSLQHCGAHKIVIFIQ